ncbi:MAG TPA: hypothetical protein VNN73_09205 [Blastocatellia bacterium]|nr:hypothetical protein [Blastocatellia bacterium]
MKSRYKLTLAAIVSFVAFSSVVATAQDSFVVLSEKDKLRVVPTSFYFEGQSAPTQMRNAAAARLGDKRFVIAGLVDTSGYSVEVRAKYEGFFITDSSVTVGGKEVTAGAYGFGFSDDGKFNLFDVGGNPVMSAETTKDKNLRRPRPLMMRKASDGLRLYNGRDYVVIAAK